MVCCHHSQQGTSLAASLWRVIQCGVVLAVQPGVWQLIVSKIAGTAGVLPVTEAAGSMAAVASTCFYQLGLLGVLTQQRSVHVSFQWCTSSAQSSSTVAACGWDL